MDPSLLAPFLQFGLAGLMGYLWLMERRASAARDQQLTESHAALMQEREKLDILIAALESNTRAITALELGQRRLVDLFERSPSDGVSAVRPRSLTTVNLSNEPRPQ